MHDSYDRQRVRVLRQGGSDLAPARQLSLRSSETSFNRDTHPFEEFRRQILPALAETVRRRREERYPVPLARIWSAGCSTGQEPYSLAMAIHEFIAANPALDLRPEHFPILATDVSAKSLSMAKAGRYPDRDVDRGLTKEQRNRHFRPHGEFWTASDDLRRWIEFRRLNFMDRVTTLGPFEVIFCRNVLIYFDTPSRQTLCDQFHQLLAPGGLLVLGAAESLYGLNTSFQSEPLGSTMVYRKTLP